MENNVSLLMESRIHGDMYVRFGGRYGETYCRKAERHSVPSLQSSVLFVLGIVAIASYARYLDRSDLFIVFNQGRMEIANAVL